MTQKSAWFFVRAAPSVAYRVNDCLSLGAALAANYTVAESLSSINNRIDTFPDGKAKLDTDGVGLSFSLPSLIELSERTRIGIVYNSETEPKLEGKPNLQGSRWSWRLGPAGEEGQDGL